MRLTLRTLLAYLDDVLPPQDARELGQKIQESPDAQTLSGRIREVIRKRRLGAPDLTGPEMGIDPNHVAQYLDNTLPAESVAEMERVCLHSDVHLAEVAASHQILTLAMGEPVDIPPAARERFYGLGEGHAIAAEGGTTPAPQAAPVAPAAARAAAVPEEIRRRPMPRLLPAALVLIIAVGWLGLLASQYGHLIGLKPRVNEIDPTTVVQADPTALPAPKAPAVVPVPAPAVTSSPTPAPTGQPSPMIAKVEEPKGPAASVPEPRPASPMTGTEPASPADVTMVEANAKPGTTPPPAAPMPAPPTPLTDTVPMTKPAAGRFAEGTRVEYVSTEGILLHRGADDEAWTMLARRSEIRPGDLLACPDPFEAQFNVGPQRVRVTVLGDTLVEWQAAEGRPLLRLLRGRLLVQPGPQPGDGNRLDLQVGGERMTLRLDGAESTAAVELAFRLPSGFEENLGPNRSEAGLYAVGGPVSAGDGDKPVWTLAAGGFRPLTAAPSGSPIGTTGLLSSALPGWVDPQQRRGSAALRRYATLYEKEFELDQPADLELLALIKDQRPKIAELAVTSLALLENLPGLVQALAQSEHEESRLAAAAGLRKWLAYAPDRGPLLKEELNRQYPPADAAIIYPLVWGYGPTDAQDKAASLQLIDRLSHPRVEVRELAFNQIVQLSGKRLDYRPLDPPAKREAAVQRWLSQIERDGALVKPPAKAADEAP